MASAGTSTVFSIVKPLAVASMTAAGAAPIVPSDTSAMQDRNERRNMGLTPCGAPKPLRLQASGREIDSADVHAFLELDLEPLCFAAGNLDDDAITPAVGRETFDLELAVGVCDGFADDGSRALELDLRLRHAVGDAVDGLDDRSADELVRVAIEILVVHPRLRRRLRLQLAQGLARLDRGHLLVRYLDGRERAGRAHLRAARLLPAVVEQVRVEEPVL